MRARGVESESLRAETHSIVDGADADPPEDVATVRRGSTVRVGLHRVTGSLREPAGLVARDLEGLGETDALFEELSGRRPLPDGEAVGETDLDGVDTEGVCDLVDH